MARASTKTILSLDRFAQIMGIAPPHFNGAVGSAGTPIVFPAGGASCDSVFWQHAWQAVDRVSREDIAEEISMSEEEIAQFIGYWPGPKWIEGEVHKMPRHHRQDVFEDGLDNRGMPKSVKANWGRIISQGQRATTVIGTATRTIPVNIADTLVFSDADGDGFDETATITLASAVYDECEYKVYFAGHGAAEEWEVRPLRTVTVAGGNVVITLWTWQILDPDLWEAFPTSDGKAAINLDTDTNFVLSVDVYREYNDPTARSAELYWEPLGNVASIFCPNCGGTGCTVCEFTTQDGCAHVRDVEIGTLVPGPATYDAATGAWLPDALSVCRMPDQVKFWYQSGELSRDYLAGLSCDPLSHFWAETIAWLTVCRLERPFCRCSNVSSVTEWLRVDLAQTPREGDTYVTSPGDLENPFGTRRGEIRVWKRLAKLAPRIAHVAVI